MEILIILIAWFVVGLIYLINLSDSNAIDNLSTTSIVILFIIFMPTFIVIIFAYLISEMMKRIKEWLN